jgi:6-pyruvoyltetrahydropterin/6-carboxytetrahydropterin synthase
MHVIRKKFTVEYAHQLHDAYTKACYETIHGHSGVIELFLESNELDHNDMVIDFDEITNIVKKYFHDSMDHALIVPMTFDPDYVAHLKIHNKKVVVVDSNPTAEFFAESIFWDVKKLLDELSSKHLRPFKLQKVRFHETRSAYAEFTPNI